MLDTRFFRSPLVKDRQTATLGPYRENIFPSATILGEDQWAWLAVQLKTPAQVRIIVSSIQVLAQHNGWEGWSNYPAELDRLQNLLSESHASGVIFLSGDRHFAEMSQIDMQDFYPLIDITSSGLNRRYPVPVPSTNANRIDGYYLGYNFGFIEIDWAIADPAIRVTIVDAKGVPVLSHEMSLSQLSLRQDP